jgi:hypothetical protein
VGVVQVGLAISSQCRPSCGNAGSNNTVAKTEVNTSSMTPHLTGKVGDISFRAQLPSTSGTIQNSGATTSTTTGTTTTVKSADPIQGTGFDSTTTKTVSGSGYQVGAAWAASGLFVALDLAGFNDAKIDGIQASTAKARDRSSYNVRADIPAGPGAVSIMYFSIDDNNFGSKVLTSTTTTLRYIIPETFGLIIPEFRTVSTPSTIASTTGTAKDGTDSEFRLILQGKF